MSQDPDPRPEARRETLEPGGRRHQLVEKMSSEDLAAAYGDATRLRAHELTWHLDGVLGNWMHDARQELAKRGDLELVRDFLPVYFDPSRKDPVFGPGGELAGQGSIEEALRPVRPLRQIAAS